MAKVLRNLAFDIANTLLMAECIAADFRPSKIQALIQAQLALDPRFREKVVHLRDTRFKPPYGVCHQRGKYLVTDNHAEVTCLRCMKKAKK